jgi:hypothetical protein
VKYFSGTATYTKVFRVPPELVAQASSLSPSPEQRRLHLNLGKVQVIAQLKINGHDFGILWKPPFETDITSAVKVGDNLLEIKVVNLWPNRLIGDEQLPDDCQWQPAGSAGQGLAGWPNWLLDGKPSPTGRLAFATWKHWTKDSPLLESGLLGPVVLRTFSQVEAK